MATQTRTKPPSTSNKTGTVTYSQSLELVKTLIFVSASTVTYGRSIFSERHYVKRLFEPAEMKKPFSLNRFVQQDSVGERDSVKDPSKRVVRILNRGISPKVDTFLDMLDEYVFEGIRLKSLEAFELQIYGNPQRREEVLECWIFQISYTGDGNEPQLGIQFDRQGQETVKITDAQERLRETHNSIADLQSTLNSLPTERHLGIVLQYRDDCDPRNIKVEDTEPCSAAAIKFPSADLYDVRTTGCVGYSDGKHKIQVAATYIDSVLADKDIGKHEEPASPIEKYDQHGITTADDQQTTTSVVGQFTDPSPWPQPQFFANRSLEDLASPAVSQDRLRRLPIVASLDMGHNQYCHNFAGPSGELGARVEDETDNLYIMSSLSGDQGTQHLGTQAEESSLTGPQQASINMSQQSRMSVQSVDNGVTELLQSMVQTVTQPVKIFSNTQFRVEEIEMPPPSRGVPDVLAPASTEVDSVFMPESRARPAAQALRLSEDTLELLERRKPTVQESTSRATRSRLRASQNSTSQEVRCECKTLQEETDMLHCHCCEKHQHIRCYGYHGVADTRIANPHACYTCMIGDKDKPLLRDLEHLAQNRRVISVAQSDGFVSISLLKAKLGLDTKAAQETTSAMVNEGLLMPKRTTGATRPKAAKEWTISLQPEHGPVTDAARRIFDPTAHIAHLFDDQSMAPIGTLTSLYGAMTADPLLRSSSIGNMSRLGRPHMDVTSPATNGFSNDQASRVASLIMDPTVRAIEVPRTPTTSSRGKRRLDAGDPTEGRVMARRRRLLEVIDVAPSPSTRVQDDNEDLTMPEE